MASEASHERTLERAVKPLELASPFACSSHVTSRESPNGQLARRLKKVFILYSTVYIIVFN